MKRKKIIKKKSQTQLAFDGVSGWGGRRTGAGRKNRSGTVNHMARPGINLKTPLHITLRLKERLPSLRNKKLFKEFRRSVRNTKDQGLFILHFSVQSNHIHLFAEAASNRALSLGMRALAGRFAKIIRCHAQEINHAQERIHTWKRNHRLGENHAWKSNRSGQKKGSVFHGRYHLHVLTTPKETRNALEYVLLNLPKHQKRLEHIDEFSSGAHFQEWKKLLGARYRALIKTDAEFFKSQNQGARPHVSNTVSGVSNHITRQFEISGQASFSSEQVSFPRVALRQTPLSQGPLPQAALSNEPTLANILSPPRSWLARVGWMRACT